MRTKRSIKNFSFKKDFFKIFITILLLEFLIAISYFSYSYLKLNEGLQDSLATEAQLKGKIQALKRFKNESISPSEDDKRKISQQFENQEFSFGAKVVGVKVLERLSKKGSKTRYFRVKLDLVTKSKDSLKKFLVLQYLNPRIYKIIYAERTYLEFILKG